MATALSLFAGVGFGVACERMNITELGVENDLDVVASRHAAGMTTIAHDVWDLAGPDVRLLYDLLTAGPPCQTFSKVGRGHGRRDIDVIVNIAREIGRGADAHRVREWTEHIEDPRTALVLLPLVYAMRDRPEAIVLEQVPAVLPVWEAYAHSLTMADYSVWVGIVEAEAYGVPQTRRRAVLIASRNHDVTRPARTHSRYHVRHPDALDQGMPRWVSMHDAMGWPEGVVGFPRKADGRDEGVEIGDEMYRSRDLRPTDRPSWGITGKARSWRRWGFLDRPATVVTGHGFATRHPSGVQRTHLNAIEEGSFVLREPWTVSTARLPTFDNVSLSRSYHGNAVNITPEEGAVLQTFSPDFPFRGTRTKVWQTIGNAIPPLLAEHLIRAAL